MSSHFYDRAMLILKDIRMVVMRVAVLTGQDAQAVRQSFRVVKLPCCL